MCCEAEEEVAGGQENFRDGRNWDMLQICRFCHSCHTTPPPSPIPHPFQDTYPAIQRARICPSLHRCLVHTDPVIRARACNVVGNLCKQSAVAYPDLVVGRGWGGVHRAA